MIELLLALQLSTNSYNKLSNVLVGTNITIDTIDSFRQEDKKRAFQCQSEKLLLTVALAELTKTIVHKNRPDGSDNKSFYSEHTALSFVSSGWNFYIGIPIAIETGIGRIGAKKHDWIDVSAGAGIGLLTSKICHK